MLGSGGGELGSGNSIVARERAAAVVVDSGSVVRSVLFCVFPLSVSLLLLFPLFAVLLNCPYPDPLVSACFFPFSSATRWGEWLPCGAFVASRSQTITTKDTWSLTCFFHSFPVRITSASNTLSSWDPPVTTQIQIYSDPLKSDGIKVHCAPVSTRALHSCGSDVPGHQIHTIQ